MKWLFQFNLFSSLKIQFFQFPHSQEKPFSGLYPICFFSKRFKHFKNFRLGFPDLQIVFHSQWKAENGSWTEGEADAKERFRIENRAEVRKTAKNCIILPRFIARLWKTFFILFMLPKHRLGSRSSRRWNLRVIPGNIWSWGGLGIRSSKWIIFTRWSSEKCSISFIHSSFMTQFKFHNTFNVSGNTSCYFISSNFIPKLIETSIGTQRLYRVIFE